MAEVGRFLEFTYDGVVNAAEMEATVRQGVALAIEHDVWSVLSDCTDLMLGPAVLDLYELVGVLARHGAIATYREALLRPLDAAAAESVRFWETAAVNHGLQSRTFTDRDRAIAWLAG